MKALDEILVVIPGPLSMEVCGLGDLMRECMDRDDLDEAIQAASIDAPFSVGDSALPELAKILERMRKSNAAPDFCYWEPEPAMPPFTFMAGGNEYEMADPATLDPTTLQRLVIRNLIVKGDVGRLARDATAADLRTVVTRWGEHYGLPTS